MANEQQRPQYENRSRLGLATPAIRPGMKGRMLLGGPSGAGKTYTALLIAMVLREHTDVASVLQIDTEKDSGRTYADEFVLEDGTPAYQHISWNAPYNATDLAMTLRDASGQYDVVIVDSHTHFWKGAGGVLDVAGGRWTGWAEARPMHTDMVDAILSCDCHVILCARMTQEHEQVRNPANGKIEVVKLGMKIQQDADLEYEMNVGLEMDMNHILRVTKSRTRAVPVGREYIAGHAEEFAGQYREWLQGGEPAASKEQTDNLVAALNRIADPANRMLAKRQFVDTFGRPEMLLISRLPEAAEWVANTILGYEPDPDRAPDAEPVPQPTAEQAPGGAGAAGGQPGPNAPAAAQTATESPKPPPSPATTDQTGQSDGAEPVEGPAPEGVAPVDEFEAGDAEECQHLSATGVDQAPDGPGKVWACDGCGRRYTEREDGEGTSHKIWLDPPAEQGSLTNAVDGDTGHCSGCGAASWFSGEAAQWRHCDPELDDAVCPLDEVVPAAAGTDVDALYAATRPATSPGEPDAARRAAVAAEVGALSHAAVVRELGTAGLPARGKPAELRARLAEWRLEAGAPAAT